MTTIATNRERMAADTRIVGDVISNMTKIRQFGHRIFGCAGDMVLIAMFWEWAESGFPKRQKPAMPKGSFDAIELTDDGIWAWEHSLSRYPLKDSFHAIGTGAMAAKTAMLLGKSPEEAITVASVLDENTGPEAEYLVLKGRRK